MPSSNPKHRFALWFAAAALLAAVALAWFLSAADSRAPQSAPGARARASATSPAPEQVSTPAAELPRAEVARTPAVVATPGQPGCRGRVLDARGQPIAGVAVHAFPLALPDPFTLAAQVARGVVEAPLASTTTARDGSYTVALPPAWAGERCELRLVHDEHADTALRTEALPPGRWLDVGDVRMADGLAVRGAVVALDTERPIAGATVLLRAAAQSQTSRPTPGRERGLVTTTDGDGRFRFDHAATGNHALRAEAAGLAATEIPQVQVAPGEDREFTLAMAPGAAIAGTVVDAVGGPVPDAMVRAEALTAPNQPLVWARSAADGRFRLDGLAHADYRVRAAAREQQPNAVEPIPVGRTDVVIALRPQAALWLRVVDEAGGSVTEFGVRAMRSDLAGSPQAAGSLRFRVTAEAVRDGRYRVAGLDPGEWRLEVAAPGHAKAVSPPLALADAGAEPETTVVVRAGGSVVGRVLGAGGAPLANATLELLPASTEGGATAALFLPLLAFGATEARTASAADGAFALEHIAPGTYLLRLGHPAAAPQTLRGLTVTEGAPLALGPVRLEVGTRVSGTAQLDGLPLAQARVQVVALETVGAARGFVAEATTDAQGRWTLPLRLGAGRYQFVLSRRLPGNPFQESADEAQSRIEVRLQREPDYRVDLTLRGTPPNAAGR